VSAFTVKSVPYFMEMLENTHSIFCAFHFVWLRFASQIPLTSSLHLRQVWMEEDGETVFFLLSFLIAPEAIASGNFFKEESIWKT